MRRAAVGLLAAALLAVALAPGAASGDGCAWSKHSKRVTKKVKRHGKVRRVKRVKHWWTCETLPPLAGPPPPAPQPPPVEEDPGPELGHLGVKAKEWSYTLSRPEVEAGEVIVELQNSGEDPHNLNIEPEGSESDTPLQIPITSPQQQRSARFNLPPGTYRLWCDLSEHDAKGMHATLVVVEGA